MAEVLEEDECIIGFMEDVYLIGNYSGVLDAQQIQS